MMLEQPWRSCGPRLCVTLDGRSHLPPLRCCFVGPTRSAECAKVTTLLKAWYEAMKTSGAVDFEVIYVNSDREEDAFRGEEIQCRVLVHSCVSCFIDVGRVYTLWDMAHGCVIRLIDLPAPALFAWRTPSSRSPALTLYVLCACCADVVGGMPWPSVAFGSPANRQLARALGVSGLPTLVVYKSDGTVVCSDATERFISEPEGFPWPRKTVEVCTRRVSARGLPAALIFCRAEHLTVWVCCVRLLCGYAVCGWRGETLSTCFVGCWAALSARCVGGWATLSSHC